MTITTHPSRHNSVSRIDDQAIKATVHVDCADPDVQLDLTREIALLIRSKSAPAPARPQDFMSLLKRFICSQLEAAHPGKAGEQRKMLADNAAAISHLLGAIRYSLAIRCDFYGEDEVPPIYGGQFGGPA